MDNIDQPSFYIPYHPDTNPSRYSPFPDTDLPDGYELRFAFYKQAWAKCLARVQHIIRTLHHPVTSEIVRQVKEAYTVILPGLPYPELPVISVSAQGGGSSVLQDVATELENLFDEDEGDGSCAVLVHLHPSDCPNITATMKSMILGFIEASPESRTKRKATTSLAVYDIELLKAWYTSPRVKADAPQLVVVLHEFEQFEPSVIQDLFYICSLNIPQLPLVFILSLSSPSEPSYLHAAYSRSTLALLHIRSVTVSSGVQMLEELLSKTFFDPAFDLDIALGPTVLDFIHEYFIRSNCSLDAVTNILQLTYMKHIDEPLTIFLYDENLGTDSPEDAISKLQRSDSFTFLEYVLTRLLTSCPDSVTLWKKGEISAVLETISEARKDFSVSYKNFKVGFSLVMKVRTFMLDVGYKTADGDGVLEMMSKGLRGRLSRDWRYLGMMIKKLSMEHLGGLLERMDWMFQEMPEGLFEQEAGARAIIVSCRQELSDIAEGGGASMKDIASRIGDWFTDYCAERLTNRLDEGNLWDIWYTSSTPFPSELINPAPRAHITAALLHPEDYTVHDLRTTIEQPTMLRTQLELSELPDTSILFKRYLEAGRMINVYDWFESFALVLEEQQRDAEGENEEEEEVLETPSKHQTGKAGSKPKPAKETDAEKEEKWGMEVQARFIRGLHELDFMGLIKHTGRKADHVLKTVFDVAD